MDYIDSQQYYSKVYGRMGYCRARLRYSNFEILEVDYTFIYELLKVVSDLPVNSQLSIDSQACTNAGASLDDKYDWEKDD